VRHPAGSKAFCCASSVGKGCSINPRQLGNGGSAGDAAHATGAGCSLGVTASEWAGRGTNGSVGMANCSVMQGHDGPLYTSSQLVRNMPTSSVADTDHAISESRRIRQHLAAARGHRTLMQLNPTVPGLKRA
jgi:hypothetical protein